MNKKIQDIIEYIDNFNSIMDKKLGYDNSSEFYLSYEYATTYQCVKFLNEIIWDDQDNHENYLETINEYESIEQCLNRRIYKLRDKITKNLKTAL